MKTYKHPLDFAALDAGSIIDMDELESALMAKRDTDTAEFDTAAFFFAGEITNRMRREGQPHQQHLKALYRRKRGIAVLHASDHKDYSVRRIRNGLRGIVTGAAEMYRVDRTALTNSEQRELDGEIAKAEFLTTALQKKPKFKLPLPKEDEPCSKK